MFQHALSALSWVSVNLIAVYIGMKKVCEVKLHWVRKKITNTIFHRITVFNRGHGNK